MITKLYTLIISFIVINTASVFAQCNTDALMAKYAPTLDDFMFVKSFNVEVKKDGEKSNYSYVFSRGAEYKLVLSDANNGKKMIINLLDRDKKLIATNFIKSSKKYYPAINYMCNATGVYYVEAYFEGEKSGCGINILGVKKK